MHKKVVKFSILALIIVLIISNITLFIKYKKVHKEVEVKKEIIYRNGEDVYDKETLYYKRIDYKTFKNKLKSEETITVAVIDNSSSTYDKFLEMVNKIAFYKNTNIYLLEISKLTKKNEVEFYEIDDSLKELESDYLITIKKQKVIAKVTFDKEEINNIIKSIE